MCLFIILFCFLVVFVVSREFFIFAYIFGFSYLLFSPFVRLIFFRLSIRHIYNMKWILMNFCLRNDATYAYRFSFRFCLSLSVSNEFFAHRTHYPYMRHTMPANALRTHLNSNNWHALKCTKKKQQQRAHRLQYTVRIITIICDGQVDSTRFRDGFVFSLYTSISRLFRRLTICYRVCAVFNATLDAIVCLARAPAKRFRQMHLQDQFNKRWWRWLGEKDRKKDRNKEEEEEWEEKNCETFGRCEWHKMSAIKWREYGFYRVVICDKVSFEYSFGFGRRLSSCRAAAATATVRSFFFFRNRFFLL